MANNSCPKKKIILNPPHLGPDEKKKLFRKNGSFPFAIAVVETQRLPFYPPLFFCLLVLPSTTAMVVGFPFRMLKRGRNPKICREGKKN
jgi:hypothetical protein